jgi:hypothetical protein
MDPAAFHAKMDSEKTQPASPTLEEGGDWKDRGYTPWTISSPSSRWRAKNERRRALKKWRRKQSKSS